MTDQTENGSCFRILTLLDEHTRQCLAIHPGWSIRDVDVITVVQAAIARYGVPEHLRSDNGPEFAPSRLILFKSPGPLSNMRPLEQPSAAGTASRCSRQTVSRSPGYMTGHRLHERVRNSANSGDHWIRILKWWSRDKLRWTGTRCRSHPRRMGLRVCDSASPELSRQAPEAHKEQLDNRETDRPVEPAVHEAVGMQTDTQHIDSEP